MLNDKPLRAADSRTARQTISQAAKIGRQQAAIQYARLPEYATGSMAVRKTASKAISGHNRQQNSKQTMSNTICKQAE